MKKGKNRQGLFYPILRTYALFLNDCFLYKKVYRIGKENIPPEGTPVIFVSNHQNCLCDPLSIIFSVRDRKINMFVRADVFSIHPWLTRFFKILAMNPAFRLDFDGKELLWKNKNMFKETECKILNGASAMMYPEGKHQGKHWLGDFTFGYTKLAFNTAGLSAFQTDIWIQPCCNHYSSYRDIQQELVVEFGKPVSLKPFYELYQTKPRTAQRQVNEIVRKEVMRMMLHISDLENYKAIDFLRNTYGRTFAETQGFNSNYLPDKLHADQLFVEKLQTAMNEDPSSVQTIYNDVIKIERELKKLKIRDDNFDKTPGWFISTLSVFTITTLLPLWLFSLWPNIIIYKIPNLVMRRVKDKMFYNSFLYVISLLTMPFFYTLSFILVWIYLNVWIAFIYSLALPWFGLFAYNYWRFLVKTIQDIRFRYIADSAPGQIVRDLRKNIHEQLDKLFLK